MRLLPQYALATVFIAVALFFSFCSGCGGDYSAPPAVAVRVVETSGDAVEAADDVFDPVLRAAIDRAEGLAEEAAHELLSPYLIGAEVLIKANAAVEAAEYALEHWGSIGSANGWARIACMGDALFDLATTLESMGVPIPETLDNIIGKVAGLAGAFCE